MAKEEEIEEDEDGELVEINDVSLNPNDNADPQRIIDAKISKSVRDKYDVYSYRNAAVILSETHPTEFADLIKALDEFVITTEMIRKAGGAESDMPRVFSKTLRPLGWHETVIGADLNVTLDWKEEVRKGKNGKAVFEKRQRILKREKYLDGHKIDYVKGKVAFDLEWNSKDQTFDRDLYAMNAFFLSGAIDVGVLVTRSKSLDEVFRSVGNALDKNGDETQQPTYKKYGASTTWMGKLIYRLNAGRNGGCPVLAIGITPAAVSDWKPPKPKLGEKYLNRFKPR